MCWFHHDWHIEKREIVRKYHYDLWQHKDYYLYKFGGILALQILLKNPEEAR
jgi:hypothetical protein